MKTLTFISRGQPLLAAGLVVSLNGSAHEYTNGILGPTASATDYHQVSCAPETEVLEFQLRSPRVSGSPPVSAQIQVQDKSLAVTTHANQPEMNVPGGNSRYHITVVKNGPGRARYDFSYHCYGDNQHTDTELNTPQNQ